jgi:hypothetical protein
MWNFLGGIPHYSHAEMNVGFHVKCQLLLSDFNQYSNVSTNFTKTKPKLYRNPFIGHQVRTCGQTDGHM